VRAESNFFSPNSPQLGLETFFLQNLERFLEDIFGGLLSWTAADTNYHKLTKNS
jgi:hypothetical protein